MARKAKRKYVRRGRPPGRPKQEETNSEIVASAAGNSALTITQRLHNAEQERDAANIEVAELRRLYQQENEAAHSAHLKEVRGLQNEVGMLRAMLSRLTYGGVHVRDIDSIGIGAR